MISHRVAIGRLFIQCPGTVLIEAQRTARTDPISIGYPRLIGAEKAARRAPAHNEHPCSVHEPREPRARGLAFSQAVLYGAGPSHHPGQDRRLEERTASVPSREYKAASCPQWSNMQARRGGCQCGSIFALQRSCDAWPRGREGRRPNLRRCDGISPPDVPSSLIRFASIDRPRCHVPPCGSLLHIHATPDILDELHIAAVEIVVAQRELGW